MVEVGLCLVESADDHRHVISALVLLGIGVHNPFVARHGNGDVASDGDKVSGELSFIRIEHVARNAQTNLHVLKVKSFTSIYFQYGFRLECRLEDSDGGILTRQGLAI